MVERAHVRHARVHAREFVPAWARVRMCVCAEFWPGRGLPGSSVDFHWHDPDPPGQGALALADPPMPGTGTPMPSGVNREGPDLGSTLYNVMLLKQVHLQHYSN
jgi:hypothetical protein